MATKNTKVKEPKYIVACYHTEEQPTVTVGLRKTPVTVGRKIVVKLTPKGVTWQNAMAMKNTVKGAWVYKEQATFKKKKVAKKASKRAPVA